MIHVLLLPWDPDQQHFNTDALDALQSDHEVTQLDSQLVRVGGAHHLLLVLKAVPR